ncbi:hypothetical protein [Jiella avicenniae]|uniref:Caspase domain-containing protein n=1 Tax=Jiella avicenniae TaxID=2907202 RepID=A0A9X1P518_9HYPH|nr:hypothetical protein [Jiella avicenniae]MCE7029391.1 hypothetical protein [Jiella avicenniae]
MNTDDHAVVIGVGRYPTLGGRSPAKANDLKGPDEDAKAVAAWLADPNGGGVPAANIQLVRSANYADPFDGHGPQPIENDIVQAFLTVADAIKQSGHPGRRLYIYAGGHGFSPERKRGALFTANADDLNRAHLYVSEYFNWFVNGASFAQYVLWFDACSSRDRLFTPQPPSFLPRFAPMVAKTVEMSAYAANFTQKAVENLIDGRVRGVFTHSLLQGLSGKAVDPATGAITTASLRNHLFNDMRRYMSQDQIDDPDISTEPDFGAVDDFVLIPGLAPPAPAPAPVTPVAKVKLSVKADDEATEILLVNEAHALAARGLGAIEIKVPKGRYLLRAKLGRAEHEQRIELDSERTIQLPGIQFASAAPLAGTSRIHETHEAASFDAIARINGGPGERASLMVMTRWWSDTAEHRRFRAPHSGLTLLHHGSERFDLASGASEGDIDRDRWATRTISIDPGLHRLDFRIGGKSAASMTISGLTNFQTRLYLLFAPNPDNSFEPRLVDASVFMWNTLYPERPDVVRLTDAARLALADERSTLSPQLLQSAWGRKLNPMMMLYALHHMLLLKQKEIDDARQGGEPGGEMPQGASRPVRFDPHLFDLTLDEAETVFGEDHPDIRAIRFAAAQDAGFLPITMPPMLWPSWSRLMEASNRQPRLIPLDIAEMVAEQPLSRPHFVWFRRSARQIRRGTHVEAVAEILNRAERQSREVGATLPRPAADGGAEIAFAPAPVADVGGPAPAAWPQSDAEMRARLSRDMGLPRSVVDAALARCGAGP